MMTYLQLFFEFFKTGLFAVGGGLATLPFLADIADKTGWFTQADLANMVAISESTPGPIGINMATYAGFTTGGLLGVLLATLGIITPCIIVILIVARVLKAFGSNPIVQSVFYGLRPASAGLIAAALVGVAMMSLIQWDLFQSTGNVLDLVSIKGLILAVVIYLCTKKFKKIHPAAWLGLAAVVGIVFQFAGV